MRRTVLIALLLLTQAPVSAWAQYWIYTVRPGDTIWDVTEEYLADIRYWRKLQALNQVQYPERLPPGDRLRIPIAWLKLQPALVRVVESRGDVEVTSATAGRRVPIRPGLELGAGDAVHTGPTGSVTLEFGDQSRLSVQSNSYLVLDTVSAYGSSGMLDTRLRLQQGRVDSRIVRRQGLESHYEIWTPAAVSAVRGTRYRVSAADRRTRTEVIEGLVSVAGESKTRWAPALFGVLAEQGKPPAAPVRLLPAPAVDGLPQRVERVPLRCGFTALRGATAYRVQIAPTGEFKILLFDATLAMPQIIGPDLPDGNYVLRLRGIDAHGLEGNDAYHRFTVKARPEPPFLLEPRPHAMVLDRPPTFRWSSPPGAGGYHFQLADNLRFDRLLVDSVDHPQTSLTPPGPLPPGWYYWRVATLTVAGEQGPFSDPQSWQLQPAARAGAPDLTDDSVTFRWSAGLSGQRYQFQLASDPEFAGPLVSMRVAEPQATLSYPPSGVYYLRIKTLEKDGREGPFGPAQRVSIPPRSYWPYAVFTLLIVVLAL